MKGRIILLLTGLLFVAPQAQALVTINEIFADPAIGLAGDANGDGIRSTSDDEFLEFYNTGTGTVDISGWKLNDAASTRHIFPSGTSLLPGHYLVIFGGGTPNLPGVEWQLASSGGLSLNNTSETLTVFDISNQIIEQIIYGSLANQDQAIVRFPEGSGNFLLHSSLQDAEGRLFSPGRNISGQFPIAASTVPEPSTLATFLLGALSFFRRKI